MISLPIAPFPLPPILYRIALHTRRSDLNRNTFLNFRRAHACMVLGRVGHAVFGDDSLLQPDCCAEACLASAFSRRTH